MNRPRLASRMSALALLTLALCSCDNRGSSSSSGGPPQPGAKPGRLVGKLADARGGPLSNVTVSIFGFSDNGEPVTREVRVRGPATEYQLELPPGKYNTPVARIGVDYNERWYDLPLAAADDTREWTEQRDSRRGMVRDWVWRISGRAAGVNDATPAGYWGGTIAFDKQGELGDYAEIQVTLKPDGALIDGSAGEVITFNRRLPWAKHDDHYLFDVPIGRYVASVTQTYGAKPKPLRITCYTIDPTHPDSAATASKTDKSAPVEFECVELKPGEFKLLVPNLVAFPPK